MPDRAPPPGPQIQSLAQLKAATMACRECPIGAFATQSVTGEGRLKARLMLVGEQPRADGLEVLVTLHPSALLRVDSEQREAAFEAFVADLRQAQRLFRR